MLCGALFLFLYIYNSTCSRSTLLVGASQALRIAPSYVHRVVASSSEGAAATSNLCTLQLVNAASPWRSVCDWFMQRWIATSHLYPPASSPLPLLPALQQWKEECAQYGLRVTAPHALPQAFCQNVQKPREQTKKLLWMFIMYKVLSPHIYQRLYPSGGERSERDGL